MQIKGFYYKSKSGDISSLNTTNIDVPDAITSTQLENAKAELQAQIDQKLQQSDVAQLITDVTDLNTRLLVQEGRSLVETDELDAYTTTETFNSEKVSKDEALTVLQEAVTSNNETLTNSLTILGAEVQANTSNVQKNSNSIETLKTPIADITAILNRINELEAKVYDLRHTDVEVAEIPEEAVTDNKGVTSKTVSSENEVKVENVTTDTDKLIVSAKAIEVHGLTQANNTTVLTSKGDVTITDVQNSGTLARTVSNAQLSVQSPEYVRVSDCTFGCDGHNVLEIGLSASTLPPKSVIIDNCDFTKVNNNAILVFGMQEGGVVTISNCHFGNVSDCVRYSNRLNVKNVTFNFVNCTCDHWDTDPTWAGFMILQDYTSGTKEKEEENNLFSSDKVKVNFINCTGPYGKIDAEHYGTDQAHYTGNAFTDEDGIQKQLVYVWNSKGNTVNYNENRYPTVTLS